MIRRVIAVVACALLALVAATVWVPVRSDSLLGELSGAPPGDPVPEYRLIWQMDTWVHSEAEIAGTDNLVPIHAYAVRWKLVFLTQAVVLLLGGGLLTFVVRRERRRQGSPAEA